MKRTWGSVIATAIIIAAVAMPAISADRTRTASTNVVVAQTAAKLRMAYTAAELQSGVYVGSNFCLACHKSMSSYLGTNHASFVRRPLQQWSLVAGKGVIADYDGNKVDDFVQGLDFNTISSGFDKYKPNAPKLSVENGKYFVTIGSLKMELVLTVAGQRNGSAQRYVVRVPVSDTANKLSTSVYFAPLQYTPGYGSTATGTPGWAPYSPNGWYDATTNTPKFAEGVGSAALVASGGPSNHTAGCTGCHMGEAVKSIAKTASGETKMTGFTAVLFNSDDPNVTDYDADGNFELMNIGCEACHGPGSNHILGGGDPTLIVNPKNLKPAAQAEICGRCHVTGKSVPTGSYNWPYNDATGTNWTPFDAKAGTALSTFYTDTANYWPDGVTPNGGRPFNSYKISNHATFQAHTVGCPECHDPHNEGEGALVRESSVQGTLTIKTSAEDNSLCLSCHATHGPFANFTKQDVADMTTGNKDALGKIAGVVEQHTHHPYAPERMMGLSNCIGCHMTAGHTFKAISPELTLKYKDVKVGSTQGMVNSCANGCHNNRVDIFNYGVKGTATGWANPFDLKLATALKAYFGDGGAWWNTKTTP